MSVVGMRDNASGRRKYLGRLAMQVQASKPRRAGLVNVKELGLSLLSSIRRGWYFGSQEFREKLLRLSGDDLAAKTAKTADGYGGSQMQEEWSETRANTAGIAASGDTSNWNKYWCDPGNHKGYQP